MAMKGSPGDLALSHVMKRRPDMAISEKTKQLSLQERQRLQNRYDKNLADAEALEAQAAALKVANVAIAKDIAALKKDIPAPTPSVITKL